jgi:hypothetical protein
MNNSLEQFQNQALNVQSLNRQRMSEVVRDSLSQQLELGNPQQNSDKSKLRKKGIFNFDPGAEDFNGPSIKIQISGMLNEAMTAPAPTRKSPSIDIKIS